ncbi:hypothetical protein [Dactylosporangium salmoneum]|uniref:Uncharacterized protein n=1 Tax=Dactylosporangium salmoneum TaxID=53361 RepID=A0ABP5UCY0_9ACTN
MRKLIGPLIATCTAALAVAVGATPAQAYQVPGSTWTWHRGDNVVSGIYYFALNFEDTNDLSSGCDHFYISGDSNVYRYAGSVNPAALELRDTWTFGVSVGSVSVNAPAGAGSGFTTGSNSVSWDTTVNGYTSSQHYYRGGNNFAVGTSSWFYRISHQSDGFYNIGGNWYHLGKERHETLC